MTSIGKGIAPNVQLYPDVTGNPFCGTNNPNSRFTPSFTLCDTCGQTLKQLLIHHPYTLIRGVIFMAPLSGGLKQAKLVAVSPRSISLIKKGLLSRTG
jgi:hypothetical protein